MDARCAICNQDFDDDSKIPRLIPTCGLSYCEKCLIEAQHQSKCQLYCPIDNQKHSLIYDTATLPINIALMKTLIDLKTSNNYQQYQDMKNSSVKSYSTPTPLLLSSTQSFTNVTQLCPIHNKMRQFRCLQDNQFICSYCILFGQHQNHVTQNVNKIQSFQHKQQIESLFEQVLKRMRQLDINIKQFLEPPNAYSKNIQALKQSLKYQVKRIFKTYHQIIIKKQQEIQKQIDNIILNCHSQMQQIEKQLNTQYGNICGIKQQINLIKHQLNNSDDFGVTVSERKAQDLLSKIMTTSNQLVKINQNIVKNCDFTQRQYKWKINQKQFIKISLTSHSLIHKSEQQGLSDIILENQSNILVKSKSFDSNDAYYMSKLEQNNLNNNYNKNNTCIIKTHKSSMFAQSNFPQYLQINSQISKPFNNRLNTISQLKSKLNLNNQINSSLNKTLNRNNSVFIENQSNLTSNIFYSKSPDSSIHNRSKIQSIRNQQQRRQSGRQQVRQKISKILQSIECQRGTTLQLIGMEIKDYFINQIFNFIKKNNRKYGLIKFVKNQITDEGFDKILFQLRNYEYIHTLNLTSNCLTEECLSGIPQFSFFNKSLKNFYLKNNQINHIRTKDKKQQILEMGINLFY